MIRENLVKLLLSPIAALFGLGILIRNSLYQWGILKAASFNLPVIGVGNLTLGGAGKTPHVEYLIRLLSPYVRIATLSRGYKRKTKGFRMVQRGDNALIVGDEPLQYYLKYPQIQVAVSESRSLGIPMILKHHPEVQTIILDDSYQHLSVTPGINILLTEYYAPYSDDVLLPAGRLREWRSGAERADIVVVTKCPEQVDAAEKENMRQKLDLHPQQELYFSKYIYGDPYHIMNGSRLKIENFDRIILLTAIANEQYLLSHMDKYEVEIHTMTYEDHHVFNPHEVSVVKQHYDHLGHEGTVIITTEKDATRLILHRDFIREHNLPILVLPIQVQFLDDDGEQFDASMKRFMIDFKT